MKPIKSLKRLQSKPANSQINQVVEDNSSQNIVEEVEIQGTEEAIEAEIIEESTETEVIKEPSNNISKEKNDKCNTVVHLASKSKQSLPGAVENNTAHIEKTNQTIAPSDHDQELLDDALEKISQADCPKQLRVIGKKLMDLHPNLKDEARKLYAIKMKDLNRKR